MKMKKSISLLLVFTLILTLFSTLSVISPSATDGESTETTVDPALDIDVVHIARGNATSNATVRTVFFKIADAADIVANETYTVKMRWVGTTINPTKSTRFIGVRAAADNYVISCERGTENVGYDSAEWTVDITPTTSAILYGCLYTNSACTTTDIYIGDIHVYDKDGNDIAIDLTETIYRQANNISTSSLSTSNIAKYYETVQVENINNVTDAATKQMLTNAFVDYGKDVMLNFKRDETADEASQAIFKKIPDSKLKAGTKYKLSIKYSGAEFGDTNYFYIRNNTAETNDTDSQIVLSSKDTGEFVKHRNYTEYIDYYTVPETPTDLYVGFFLSATAWASADLYITDMQFTDANGNNLISLNDMSDMHKISSGATRTISDYTVTTGAYGKVIVLCNKQPLDSSIFTNAQTEQKQVVNVTKQRTGNSCRIYIKIPGVLPGDYQISYKTVGLTYTSTNQFDVRTITSGSTEDSADVTLTKVEQPSLDEMTYSFSVADSFKDIYVGFYVHPDNLADFCIENLSLTKMVDGVAGENLIDPDLYLPTWYRHNNKFNAGEQKWALLTMTDGTVSYSVFDITLMDDEDESYTSLFASQHVNLKVQGTYQGYAKKATGLEPGTYRVTCVEHGVDIKNNRYPYVFIKYGTGSELTELSTANEAIREDCVEKVEGKKATYKFTYELTLEEGQDTVFAGMYTDNVRYMNAYITELSLVKVDDETVGENLFTSLKTRDWHNSANRDFLDNYAGYYNHTTRKIIYRDVTIADVNEDEATNIVDLLILSKLEDVGIELDDGTNDLVTVRNTILKPITE